MTYMNESHLPTNTSTANAEAEPSTTEKLKILTQEGTERSKRILSILRKAFSETREEFQAGRTVISPLAQAVTTETVSTFKTKGQQAADAVNRAWKDEADAPDMTERVIAFLKTTAQTAKTNLFPTAKKQASKLDALLNRRYGEDYTTFRNRFEMIRNWVIVSEPTDTESTMADVSENVPAAVIEVDSEVVQ